MVQLKCYLTKYLHITYTGVRFQAKLTIKYSVHINLKLRMVLKVKTFRIFKLLKKFRKQKGYSI